MECLDCFIRRKSYLKNLRGFNIASQQSHAPKFNLAKFNLIKVSINQYQYVVLLFYLPVGNSIGYHGASNYAQSKQVIKLTEASPEITAEVRRFQNFIRQSSIEFFLNLLRLSSAIQPFKCQCRIHVMDYVGR